jgi:hypothetical protein
MIKFTSDVLLRTHVTCIDSTTDQSSVHHSRGCRQLGWTIYLHFSISIPNIYIPNNKVRKVSVINHFFWTVLPFHKNTYNPYATG